MNAPSITTTTIDERSVFLGVLRKCGFNVSLKDGGLRVGPAAMIGDFEKWAISEHRDGLIELLKVEVNAKQMLHDLRVACADFDNRPAQFRGKRELTPLGCALGLAQADIDAMDRRKGCA